MMAQILHHPMSSNMVIISYHIVVEIIMISDMVLHTQLSQPVINCDYC